ncbi:MAG: hypothetical protein MUE40_07730 [Anaerolineae bacterium]|jgi:hypothetical protein|nr:hypothetical protein [Anaerolineae bacterium]
MTFSVEWLLYPRVLLCQFTGNLTLADIGGLVEQINQETVPGTSFYLVVDMTQRGEVESSALSLQNLMQLFGRSIRHRPAQILIIDPHPNHAMRLLMQSIARMFQFHFFVLPSPAEASAMLCRLEPQVSVTLATEYHIQ